MDTQKEVCYLCQPKVQQKVSDKDTVQSPMDRSVVKTKGGTLLMSDKIVAKLLRNKLC